MKRLLTILLCSMCLGALCSCEKDYYEPVFGYDNLPAIIPSEGGLYNVKYAYEYYDTKSDVKYFEWTYRVIIDGVVDSECRAVTGSSYFSVSIPRNKDAYPKAILVEASTHVDMGLDDYWGDWTPVCSAVQQAAY